MRRLLVSLFFGLVLGAILAAGGAYYWASTQYTVPGPKARSGEETVVLIKPGEGLSAIAGDLDEAGVIAHPDLFRWAVRLNGLAQSLRAGEYAIPSQASMEDIASILASGKSIEHKLTVAEGLTSEMAYRLVQADPVLTGDAGPVPAEGTLLPETYLFIRGTTREALMHRMQTARDKVLAKLWAQRAKGLPLASPQQAVILASIVEKESALPAERRHIAAVFENRLKRGMKLQSDPTIIYGLTKGYPLGRGIRESELTRATPYNTYVIAGLPPTPICDPGKDSIAAVLNPMQSNDLYFVADGSGGHAFAATIGEHRKNVARWRQVERAKKRATDPRRHPKAALPRKRRPHRH